MPSSAPTDDSDKKDDLLTMQDVVDNIAEVLQGMDGDAVAEVYNNLCSDNIEYDGDSLWRRT